VSIDVLGTSANKGRFAMGASRLWLDIDLNAEGRHFGYARLHVSTDRRTSSWIPIPIASFKNGVGPTILLLGGVHGDEYEGQFMLMKLMRKLDIENVRGQLIILSATNAPACLAGLRTSPLDGVNLNRAYPGNPSGSPTQEIAYFLNTVLLPHVDYLVDLHSGSNTLRFLPSAHVYEHRDPERFDQLIRMLEVFGMPNSIVLRGMINHDQKVIGACDDKGVLRFSTELGGGGGIDVDSLRRAEKGLDRLLFHLGAVKEPLTSEPPPSIRLLTRLPNARYVYASANGQFEPYWNLGDAVKAGQAAGAIHFPEEPWREPEIVSFTDTGFVYAMQSVAPTLRGDALFMVCVPYQR